MARNDCGRIIKFVQAHAQVLLLDLAYFYFSTFEKSWRSIKRNAFIPCEFAVTQILKYRNDGNSNSERLHALGCARSVDLITKPTNVSEYEVGLGLRTLLLPRLTGMKYGFYQFIYLFSIGSSKTKTVSENPVVRR